MAYIDDNNELTAGKGKDPIKELDDELEKLMKELGEMENASDSEDEPAVVEDDTAEAPEDDESFDVEHPAAISEMPPKMPKKRTKAPIIIAVIVLVGLIAGAWLLFGNGSFQKNNEKENKPVATETFTDSELGEVTVKKVDGAALNTYDTDNLVKNDNGFYDYVVDGKVTSEVGIDIAEYQGDVDFAAVKKSGVDFVILRLGGRYYSEEGKMYEDGKFETYYEQATKAGLKVGAYFFSQAATTAEAAEEAQFCVEKLDGRKLDYPVAFDWEIIEDDEARTDNVDGATITAMAEKFCDTIEDEGYDSMVYAGTSLML
ncbi:MAG: hypothetical protein IJ639_04020, partial [Ruminococcus sp.]|nr:hypothetical protein [Ruminococcus sp.]